MSDIVTQATDSTLARHPVLWTISVDPEDYHFPSTLTAGDFCLTSTGKLYFYSGSSWNRLKPGN